MDSLDPASPASAPVSAPASAPTPSNVPRPDDLLVLLAVARHGSFSAAGQSLGLNHTTISRRIAALERSIGGILLRRSSSGWELTDLGRHAGEVAVQVESAVVGLADPKEGAARLTGVVRLSATDGFSAYVAAPAAARLSRRHPGLRIELVTATRQAHQQRAGLDMEIVVGEPHVHNAQALPLADYVLGTYASRAYLEASGSLTSLADLAGHPLIYFIDSMLPVEDLDAPLRLMPNMQRAVSSTNVFIQVEATRAGAGIGLLPCFMADRHEDLVRLVPDEVNEKLSYWMVVRPSSLHHPSVKAVIGALRTRLAVMDNALLGRSRIS